MIRLLIVLLGAMQPQVGPWGFDTLPIGEMCNADGAWKYRYGATNVPPSLIPGPSTRMQLPKSFAPFGEVALNNTRFTNRFAGAQYFAEFADAAAAENAMSRLAAKLRANGWADTRPAGQFEARLRLGAEGSPGDTRIELVAMDNVVEFDCAGAAIDAIRRDEAAGRFPPGTPRPATPLAPRPEAVQRSRCTTPEGRAEILRLGKDGVDPLTGYIARQLQYREMLVQWKADRLRQSGKLTEQQLADLMTNALAGAQGDLAEGLGLVTEMVAGMDDVARLETAGDDAGACTAVITLLDKVPALEKVAEPQWRAIEVALDSEAARLGISFN